VVGRLQQFLLVVDGSEMGLGVLLKEKRLALGRLSERGEGGRLVFLALGNID
jgi:hypothetical protein